MAEKIGCNDISWAKCQRIDIRKEVLYGLERNEEIKNQKN